MTSHVPVPSAAALRPEQVSGANIVVRRPLDASLWRARPPGLEAMACRTAHVLRASAGHGVERDGENCRSSTRRRGGRGRRDAAARRSGASRSARRAGLGRRVASSTRGGRRHIDSRAGVREKRQNPATDDRTVRPARRTERLRRGSNVASDGRWSFVLGPPCPTRHVNPIESSPCRPSAARARRRRPHGTRVSPGPHGATTRRSVVEPTSRVRRRPAPTTGTHDARGAELELLVGPAARVRVTQEPLPVAGM